MAIWEKLFNKITFKNYPDTSTPLNADNLNKMSDAIDGIDDRVVELNSNLAKKVNTNHPNITGVLWSKDITTGNTQVINAGGDTMIVGNTSIKLHLESNGVNIPVDNIATKEFSGAAITPNNARIVIDEGYWAYAFKYGNLVIVKCQFASAYFYSGESLFLLPEGYRPKAESIGIIECQRHANLFNTPMYSNSVHIQTDGNIVQRFNNDQTGNKWQGSIFACFSVE